MSQSLSKVLLHIVFSTKHREDLIPEECQKDLHAYIAGTCRALGSEAYRVGGTADHIHIACTLPRTTTTSNFLKDIKSSSSKWLKTKIGANEFAWQAGYGVFSLGQSQLETLIRYIDNQHDHHKQFSFKDELLDLLRKYQVDYDERYLWS
jgi:REP element-mobilizing transposase RayT